MTSMLTLNRSEVSVMAAEKTEAAKVTVNVSPAAVMVMRNLRQRGLLYRIDQLLYDVKSFDSITYKF